MAKLEVFAKIVWKTFDKKEKRYLYGLKFNGILAEDDYKLKGLLRSRSESSSPIPMRQVREEEIGEVLVSKII